MKSLTSGENRTNWHPINHQGCVTIKINDLHFSPYIISNNLQIKQKHRRLNNFQLYSNNNLQDYELSINFFFSLQIEPSSCFSELLLIHCIHSDIRFFPIESHTSLREVHFSVILFTISFPNSTIFFYGSFMTWVFVSHSLRSTHHDKILAKQINRSMCIFMEGGWQVNC